LVQALDGYTLTDTLHADEDFVLARGLVTADCTPVLIRRACTAGNAARAALEREFALRSELEPAWAAMPRALLADHARACLILDDCGAIPLPLAPGAPLPLADFLRYGAAIALSLSQMHRRLIIHQNLKPSNILVDPAGGPALLTGFGMAERIKRVQDTRADLYCTGVILHQMLTGAMPFAASGSGSAEWGAGRSGARIWNGIDPTCKSLVQKTLATSAEQRYHSAAGLYADLQHCRSMLEAQGRVEPFVLGRHDGAARVRMPGRLVGREAELALLDTALAEARAIATPELFIISGDAGSGKSALLAGLQQRATAAGATVIAGTFDQLQRDIPYATLAQAFQGMVRQRLAQGDASLAAWRLKLMAALGANARLMLELIPELKFVIGDHPAPPPLAPGEAQCRFETVFRKFLAVCCGPESTLLLCLDDLQWIDPASLKLLTHLLTHPGVRHVLLVGACRANAVGAHDPAALARDSVRAQGTRVRELCLQALDKAQAGELVAAALGTAPEAVAPLAALVYGKTAGNPYFALQFLTRIGEGGLLHYSEQRARWEWDAAAIAAREFSENVIGLMVARLRQLPPSSMELVKLLACLGAEAGLETIALVSGMSLLETDECLWPAARMGLVVREPGAYRFLHDRVREGAYSMIEAASLPERHLHIGRLLLSRTPPAAVDKQLFNIVHHMNRALGVMKEGLELRRLARLNIRAGAKARDAIAYDSARDYYSLAAGLCPARAWQDDFEATFALYIALAECEYLCGHLERAGRLFGLLTEQARTRVEMARVAMMRIALYQISGRFDQAADTALEALAMFGVSFPQEPVAIAEALAAERAGIASAMSERSIASLFDEPASQDPEVAAVSELLSDMGSSVFSARPGLYPLLAAKALNFTLRHGSTASSCTTYSRYAILLVSTGAMPDAFAYSELALRLVQRAAPLSRRGGRLRFVHGAYIHSWREPIAGSVPLLEQAFQSCQEEGDLPHAGYAAHIATWNLFESGAPLRDVVRMARQYQGFARQQRNDALLQLLRCYEQLARSLEGSTGEEGGFDDASFSGAQALQVFGQASFGAAEARFYLMRQIAAFCFGRYQEALEAADEAALRQHFFLASVNDATHHFYHALAMAALYKDAPRKRQSVLMSEMRAKLDKLRAWAAWCPVNFNNRYLLLSAELARLRGRESEALRAYDAAIASAAGGGYVQNEALACELAAAFCLARGRDWRAYALRALRAWRLWGAEGKVRQMQAGFPGLSAHWADSTQAGASGSAGSAIGSSVAAIPDGFTGAAWNLNKY